MKIANSLKSSSLMIVAVGLFVLISCSDNSGLLGLELQNPDSFVFVYNDSSTTLNTYTLQQEDLIWPDVENLPTAMLLGYHNDPKLGTFENNFMTEVNLYNNAPNFGKDPVADSIVLFLSHKDSYGDTNQIQTIKVFELNHDDTLYTIKKKPMDASVIAEYYNPEPITSFTFKPGASGKQKTVRIPFPDGYENKFMDSTRYRTNSQFRADVLNGYYFVAQPITSGGATTYFTFDDSTRMVLYYHYTDSIVNKDSTIPTRDTIKYTTYPYLLNSATYRWNIFYRSYNPAIKYLPAKSESDANVEQELFYVKNNNAFEGRIDISGLQNWRDSGNYTFNKASLLLYVERNLTDYDNLFPQHSGLEVYGTNDDYEKLALEEYIGSNGYLTVPLDTLPGGYGFEISLNRTLFNAIQNGDSILSLVLTTTGKPSISSSTRTIIKGAKNLEQAAKLKITYTKFKSE